MRQPSPTGDSPREGDHEVYVGHADQFRGKELYLPLEDRTRINDITPVHLKRRVREAHTTGPVPPRVEALRNKTFGTLKQIAQLMEDPIFALLGELSVDIGSFEQVRDFLRAGFHSDDVPSGFDSQAFKVLAPLAVGISNGENPAALGSVDFWRHHSCRLDDSAKRIRDFAMYLARHCSDSARSSGGWVYFGDLVEKMSED
eukprot:964156-Pyramimonas_sp.AAC.1